MPGFELSYMTSSTSTAAIRSLFALVDEYNHRHPHIDVRVSNMTWSEAWQQLMRVAIYKKGPDLSEIGAPWTSDFVGMNSLRSFEPAEIQLLGGEQTFSPVAWKNCQVSGRSEVWGIPARVDVRVIYYWRDLVEQAGIDPQVGFSTPENFLDSMARLRAAGFERPFTMLTDSVRNNVYHAASWIWSMGGELVDDEGAVAFHQPPAQHGLCQFFNLHPYLQAANVQPDISFLTRQSAVMMAGAWIIGKLRRSEVVSWSPDLPSRLGVAVPPGPSFVGGTNLGIWAHAGQASVQTSLHLMEYLLNSPAYTRLCLDSDFIPPSLPALADERLAGDPHYGVLVSALRSGRTHASAHLWVLLAERLGAAMNNLWFKLRQNPELDTQAEVRKLTESVAARLEQTLAVQ
jgi:multiple sugar transport system substrate-binding protein